MQPARCVQHLPLQPSTFEMPAPIPLLILEAQIKRRLRRHLRSLGFSRSEGGDLVPPDNSKETVRVLHRAQRKSVLRRERDFISAQWLSLKHHFANGLEIDPDNIRPRLELVDSGSWQGDLFRLAALTWSIPVSQGYGRRMRFLVWDDVNDRLMGLIALGDPVFNLLARDEWIEWGVEDRKARLVNVLDAYVLGALPPYSQVLGGKVVASLVRTQEIRDWFKSRYGATRGVISGAKKHASLVLVTTASAFGRSSVYNRLRCGEQEFFRSLGYTQGWGHFHIPDELFALIRQYLAAHDHAYSNGFQYGNGPNWKIRAVRQALTTVGLQASILKHGIRRELFACQLARNAQAVLAGRESVPDYSDLWTVDEVGTLAVDRWVRPRAQRERSFVMWQRDMLLTSLRSRALTQRISTIRVADGTR